MRRLSVRRCKVTGAPPIVPCTVLVTEGVGVGIKSIVRFKEEGGSTEDDEAAATEGVPLCMLRCPARHLPGVNEATRSCRGVGNKDDEVVVDSRSRADSFFFLCDFLSELFISIVLMKK